jgi:peptide/nickel transport system substrate-binding protein
MKRSMYLLLTVAILLMVTVIQCAPAATPEVVEKVVKETVVVEKPVEVTKVVEKEVVVTPTPEPPPPTPAPGPPKTTLVYGLGSEPVNLDAHRPVGRYNEIFNALIYDSLITRDRDYKLSPSLATSWEMIDDTTWQFKLREGVKFHNGEEFNAEVVKWNIEERVLDPEAKSPHVTFLGIIDHVDVVDPYTVNIVTQTPDVLLPIKLSDLYGGMIPPEYFQEVGEEGVAINPVGTGPFKFVEWVKDDHITLAANENWWNEPPKIEELYCKIIKDPSSRVAALLTGEVDLIDAVPMPQISVLEADPEIAVKTTVTTRYALVVLETEEPPLDDKRVRQAMNYAIDKQAFIDSVWMGLGREIANIFIPETFGYDPSIEPYPYDPDKAKELLAEAGYPDGFEIDFETFYHARDYQTPVEYMQAQLKEVGIIATLKITDYGIFGPRRLGYELGPMYIYSIGDWAFDNLMHVETYVTRTHGYYYYDDELIAMVEKAYGTFDPEERAKIYSDIQKRLQEEAPFIFLPQMTQTFAASKNLNWEPRVDEMWMFETAYFE